MSELSTFDLADIVTNPKEYENDVSETVLRQKKLIRDIIINHVDEHYHKKLLNITEPHLMINKIKDIRKIELNISEMTLRQKLYVLKKHKNEKVVAFNDRFDNLVAEHEACNSTSPLSEGEKTAIYYQAVQETCSELVATNLVSNRVGTTLTVEDMKNCLLQIEAQKKKPDSETPRAQVAAFTPRGKHSEIEHGDIKCYRCNKFGHYRTNCPLIAKQLWFCYTCNGIAGHPGNQCPNKIQRYTSENNFKQNTHKHNTYTTRGGGRRSDKRTTTYQRPKPYERTQNFKRQQRGQGPKVRRAEKPEVTSKGKVSESLKKNKINFIADSGATHHIINKGFILRDFKKTIGEIKSANKQKKANIKIDGKGNLYLKSIPSGKSVFLSNVIVARDISENLLSLRKFAEAGYGIYLDDAKLKIFDKETGDELLIGTYDSPNWNVQLDIVDSENLSEGCSSYTIKANLVTIEDVILQSQTVSSENLDKIQRPSEIGREKVEENHQDDNSEIGIGEIWLKRKVLDLNQIISNSEVQRLSEDIQNLETVNTTQKPSLGLLWHKRLGHTSVEYMKYLQKHEKVLENIQINREIMECESCILAKMESIPFKGNRNRSERPLHTIHADTMGKISPPSFPGENSFIVVLIDDYTRYAKAYCVKHKNESGKCLEDYLKHTRNLLGRHEKVCYIRADNGTEFTGGEFSEIMKKEGISSNFAPPHTPQLNGTAERFNKTIQMKIRALMIDSGLPATMWIFATEAAVHTYNRTPHKSNNFRTPLYMMNPKINSHISDLRRFGCIAYIKIPIPDKKFSERAIKGILVGYTPTGYLLWHPTTQRFLNSRNVRFNEKIGYMNMRNKIAQEKEFEIKNKTNNSVQIKSELNNTSSTELMQKEEKLSRKTRKRKLSHQNNSENEIRRGPKRRAKEKPFRDPNSAYNVKIENCWKSDNEVKDEEIYANLAQNNRDPISFREAMDSPDKDKWKKAIEDELCSMNENNVWQIVNYPKVNSENKKPNIIDSRWIFKKKLDENGCTKFKARLVIRGFKDKNRYELRETYAPVSRLAVIRSALSVINKYDLEAYQLDVKTAFLNGKLDEEIYMEIPEGIELHERTTERKVCKLKRTLYGLKISPKKWNLKFTEEVAKLGLERDINDPCLFTWRKNGKVIILVLYVDDIILAGNDSEKLQEIKFKLCRVFKMNDLGEPNMYLGMKIQRNRKRKEMTLSQEEYIDKILVRFKMEESKPQSTPMVTRQVKNREVKYNSEKIEEDIMPCKAPYREAIGSLLYLAGVTRPDITYAVNYLSRKQLSPTEKDWKEVKRIFRYLRKTKKVGLTFRDQNDCLEAYTDSSFRDQEDSTSTGGYLVRLYGNAIAWRSYKQNHVSLSTCHAEYLTMSAACQEIISLDKALRDMTGKTYYPVSIWCDNKSAGDCTQMDGSNKLKDFDEDIPEIQRKILAREKQGHKVHIGETHGDYIKKCVLENKMIVKWVETKENLADILTKPLPTPAHNYLRDKIINSETH